MISSLGHNPLISPLKAVSSVGVAGHLIWGLLDFLLSPFRVDLLNPFPTPSGMLGCAKQRTHTFVSCFLVSWGHSL